MEKLSTFSSRLYHTTIKPIKSYAIVNQKFNDPKVFILRHDRLGHPRSSMVLWITEHSHGHPLKNQEIILPNECSCVASSRSKLIVRPSFTKIMSELLVFLERIHEDICGPIHLLCGPFHYFMILIDAFTRWSHVCLILTCNVAFARLLAQMIILQVQFPNYPIQVIRHGNTDEFTSQTFIDYCMLVRINIEHPIAHTHTQNDLEKSFIKRLQLIAWSLLMKTALPTFT